MSVIGIDTSNYTTSIAYFDGITGIIKRNIDLPVGNIVDELHH